ncbi:helix-turn-helix domain-containing protein [Streptomyces sp. NPDC090023]|uniref:AlbA family DNA-binding domain-containing protein n=1 Tax=unclassified Streptomyces TaxID=2593676 RepID=UPI0037F66E29
MALDFDSSRAVVGLTEQQGLIRAVLGASAADETLWVEWKSDLDLLTAPGAFHVARAILGFANRMPDVADQWAEGHAYVLVGVEEGQLHGTAEIDVVKVHPKLTQYTGEGPRFQYTYVPFDAGQGVRNVLFVDVAPPRWGDPIHPLRKPYESSPNGRIFMRYMGETKPALARDVDALCERVVRREQQINIAVQRTGGAMSALAITQADEESLWRDRRNRLLNSLPQQRPQPRFPGGVARFPALKNFEGEGPSAQEVIDLRARVQRGEVLTDGERAVLEKAQAGKKQLSELLATLNQYSAFGVRDTRSADEYRSEVDEYISKCRNVFPEAIRAAASAHCAPVCLELVNRSGNNLTQVEIILALDSGVSAVLPRDSSSRGPYIVWPKTPVTYGKNTPIPLAAYVPPRISTTGSHAASGGLRVARVPEIESTVDALTVRFSPQDLRSHATLRLDPLVLYGFGLEAEFVTVKWNATCTNLDGRVEGEIVVPVRPLGVDLPNFLLPPAHWG